MTLIVSLMDGSKVAAFLESDFDLVEDRLAVDDFVDPRHYPLGSVMIFFTSWACCSMNLLAP